MKFTIDGILPMSLVVIDNNSLIDYFDDICLKIYPSLVFDKKSDTYLIDREKYMKLATYCMQLNEIENRIITLKQSFFEPLFPSSEDYCVKINEINLAIREVSSNEIEEHIQNLNLILDKLYIDNEINQVK